MEHKLSNQKTGFQKFHGALSSPLNIMTMLGTWKNTPEKGWKVLCSFHESLKSLWYNK